jgi:hypothetical protein
MAPVFEFRPRSRQGRTKGGEWNPLATPHPRSARQDAQFFSRSMRCRNGTDVNGFSMAIGPSQARLTLRSAVGRTSTTSRSTSIPTSSRPFLPARRVVYPAVPCQQILRGHWRRFHCFLHLHVGGRHLPVVVGDVPHLPVVVGDVPHLDEPLPTRGTFLPATGHAGCSDLHTGRPCLGNICGFLV